MAAACPCCGQPVPDLALLIDTAAGIVTRGDRTARLTPSQATILGLLVRAAPNIVSFDQIAMAIWNGEDEPDGGYRVVHTQVCHVRKAIAPLGIGILNRPSAGYALRADAEAITAAKRRLTRRRAA